MNVIGMAGARVGRMIVIKRAGSIKNNAAWLCRCDCGSTTVVVTKSLRSGNTQSCGCLGLERRTAAARKANFRHGLTYSPIWETWASMRRRCQDPNHKSFGLYGGRGISVCARWESFDAFFADMAPRPPGLTLDRIDTNGNYEPTNCRWATWTEQARNRRDNVPLVAFCESKLIVEWSEDPRCVVTADALMKRIEAGWPIERALSEPRYASRSRPWSTARREAYMRGNA